jgi:hypothetical protein
MFVLPENLRSTSISTLISSNSSYRCTSTRAQPSWSMRGKKGVTSRARGNPDNDCCRFLCTQIIEGCQSDRVPVLQRSAWCGSVGVGHLDQIKNLDRSELASSLVPCFVYFAIRPRSNHLRVCGRRRGK